MKKCRCKSEPDYHRDDCPEYDSRGKKKSGSEIFNVETNALQTEFPENLRDKVTRIEAHYIKNRQ